jgi:hypothetical protein
MNFQVPQREDLLPCIECKNFSPAVYADCLKPCSWVISWLMHESNRKVMEEVMTIKRWNEARCPYKLEPFEPIGGD